MASPFLPLFLPAEKGEAGAGELEAAGQRTAHQREAATPIWAQGQRGAFVGKTSLVTTQSLAQILGHHSRVALY